MVIFQVQQVKNKAVFYNLKIQKVLQILIIFGREGFMNRNEHFKSHVEHLENQNKELKNYLHTLKQKMNPSPQKSADLLLYAIFGYFIIFILDSIVTLIKINKFLIEFFYKKIHNIKIT